MTSEQDLIAELKKQMPAPAPRAPVDTRLSRLQKKIIFLMVLDLPEWQKMTQRGASRRHLRNVLGGRTKSARANLSRAY
jgi:hypothetical protein